MDYVYNLTFPEMMSKIFITNGHYVGESGILIALIDGEVDVVVNIDCVGVVIKGPLVVDDDIINMKFMRTDSQNDEWVSPPNHRWQYAKY